MHLHSRQRNYPQVLPAQSSLRLKSMCYSLERFRVPVQVELYDKAGDAIAGAAAVVPAEVTGSGTIYNPARITLSLRQAVLNCRTW